VSGLVISSSGGQRVATEDLWWLIDRLGGVVTQAEQTTVELRRSVQEYRPESWALLTHYCERWIEDVDQISGSLKAYTEAVAEQEQFRTSLMISHLVVGGLSAGVLHFGGGYHPEVSVHQRDVESGVPIASGVAERLARLPGSETPIRIERYPLPDGTTHTEVFISGTREWSLGSEDDPFDMRSNLALVAGFPAAASIAARLAMRQARVSPRDPVVFIGHSQGGAVATALAQSGQFRTIGLITAGAPVGHMPVTGDYPALRIEHTDDPIVSLGGHTVSGREVVVSRDSGAPLWDVSAVHASAGYVETAAQIDRSPVSFLHDAVSTAPEGVSGESLLFDATETTRSDGEEGAGRTTR